MFIDQEKCYACTRKRIDASWKALSNVLGSKPPVPLERSHLDTQAMQAEELMVMGLLGGLPPAIRAARLPVVVALREL